MPYHPDDTITLLFFSLFTLAFTRTCIYLFILFSSSPSSSSYHHSKTRSRPRVQAQLEIAMLMLLDYHMSMSTQLTPNASHPPYQWLMTTSLAVLCIQSPSFPRMADDEKKNCWSALRCLRGALSTSTGKAPRSKYRLSPPTSHHHHDCHLLSLSPPQPLAADHQFAQHVLAFSPFPLLLVKVRLPL